MKTTMNSRERILCALNHKEPDHVPFDLGGISQSGIHCLAYSNLRRYLGLPKVSIEPLNNIAQTARLSMILTVTKVSDQVEHAA